MSELTATPALSARDVAAFREQGYLLPARPLLPEADFTALRSTFERLLHDWVAQGGRPEAMDVPHFRHPELMRWLLHDAVLDVVEPLLGPDIAVFSSHFICKPAHDGRRVPWHEDSAYWKGVWEPMEVVTVWLALDPSTPENGNMRVIPGSHGNGYSDYVPLDGAEPEVFANRIRPGSFAEETAVDCTLAPGHYSLHHARLIHGSEPNRSASRRCGYTMRYVSTRSRFTPGPSREAFQIYLARGRDHAGNTYADPTGPNQAWLDRYTPLNSPRGH